MDIKRGDIIDVKFARKIDSNIQGGHRPCVVIQNNVGNKYSPITIVVPITHVLKKLHQKTHVVIKGDNYNLSYSNSMIIAEQIITIDKKDIRSVYGSLNDEDTNKLNEALKVSLELN